MYDTPDLSSEFHPVPKVYKAKKPPTSLKKVGTKTKEWEDARAELKEIFKDQGITKCELRLKGCWVNNALTFAHIEKRRNLTKADLYAVVLACQVCHEQVERLLHLEMKKLLIKVIQNRT